MRKPFEDVMAEFQALPMEKKLRLRRYAADSLVGNGAEEVGSSDVNHELVRLYNQNGGWPDGAAESVVRALIGEADEDEFGEEDHQPRTDFSKARILKPGEKLPASAKRIHLYPAQDIFRPRGSLRKESLSADILEKLKGAFEYWSDPAYADALSPEKLTSLLKQNLDSEVKAAWDAFMDGQ